MNQILQKHAATHAANCETGHWIVIIYIRKFATHRSLISDISCFLLQKQIQPDMLYKVFRLVSCTAVNINMH
jgi:hypothetical protein